MSMMNEPISYWKYVKNKPRNLLSRQTVSGLLFRHSPGRSQHDRDLSKLLQALTTVSAHRRAGQDYTNDLAVEPRRYRLPPARKIT